MVYLSAPLKVQFKVPYLHILKVLKNVVYLEYMNYLRKEIRKDIYLD